MKRTINDQQLDIFTKAWYHYCKDNESKITAYRAAPIGKCQARYYAVPLNKNTDIFVLQSYETLVAAIVPYGDTHICVNFMHLAYHFDEYETGRTTTQHVHKFMKRMGFKMLYHRIPKGA